MIRVGEGYYSPMNKIPPEYKGAVDRVLRDMRQVTSRMIIDGQGNQEEIAND